MQLKMLIIKAILMAKHTLVLNNSETYSQFHCIASHPRLLLHNDCMVWDYAMHQN